MFPSSVGPVTGLLGNVDTTSASERVDIGWLKLLLSNFLSFFLFSLL